MINTVRRVLLTGSLALLLPFTVGAETLTLHQVLQKVIEHYPSVKTAALQVEKAREENARVEGQLAWQLNSRAGFNRNTSLFGTANDTMNLSGSLSRQLENGGVLGLNGQLSRDDADDTFGPDFPNPVDKTRFDINYRHRLAKGAGNTSYEEGLVAAKVAETIAQSARQQLYDGLASQVIALYLSMASTQSQISNIEKTIERGQRLKAYIMDEYKLGLSEEKDVLQVEARLKTNEADKRRLLVILKQQMISLNRLMGTAWQQSINTLIQFDRESSLSFDKNFPLLQSYNAQLKQLDAEIRLAESTIRSRRDEKQDELDLVMYIGNETSEGDTLTGSRDESEVIGGVTLEYNRGLDKSSFDAALRQAHYERGISLQEKKQLLQDLQYELSSVLVQIEAGEEALKAYSASVIAEKKKLDEALKRYRDGRIETDRIIDYESQLSIAELSYELQKIELAQRYYDLNLLRGTLWQGIRLPDYAVKDIYTDELN